MKKLLFFIAIMCCVATYAQNLTLNELISLRKMDIEQVEDFLTKKGWKFKDVTTPEEGSLGMLSFVYNSNSDFDYAESFLRYYFGEYGQENRIWIQISRQSKYSEYLQGVKKFGKGPYTMADNGNLKKIYSGATTAFEFTTTTASNKYGDTGSVWYLLIVENSDYVNNLINVAEEEEE
ncbi:hypothetical protein ACK1KB_03970 [Chryseobacterium sp. TY3]